MSMRQTLDFNIEQYMGVPPRCGNVKNAEKFDAQFFGIDDMTADSIDPQLRLFYEVVYETICDAVLLIIYKL
ncbi:hypothetical protein B4U80_04993 [Leptotrombidium deliense]|uniref:Beta-ketoacyl synthase-like N-terminal domain-containing protein n=1 Tax=Leptotrombidium deliense TaxID=299467 RepID=A0A443SGD1_9ACAR|nr:hypothetical protein B4U80_04993 [Leptotrombidium deliense]